MKNKVISALALPKAQTYSVLSKALIIAAVAGLTALAQQSQVFGPVLAPIFVAGSTIAVTYLNSLLAKYQDNGGSNG